MAGMRRRRGAKVPEDEDLSEGEETVPPPPPKAQSDDESEEGSYYSDEEYDEEEGNEEYEEDEYYEDGQYEAEKAQNAQVQAPPAPQPQPTQQEEIESPKEVPIVSNNQEGEEIEDKKGEKEETEEKEDPSRVPTAGRFFMHDDRAASGRRSVKPGVKKLWEEDEGLWTHDKFESLDLEDRPPRLNDFGRGGRGRGRGQSSRRGRQGGRGRGFYNGNNAAFPQNTGTTQPQAPGTPTQPQAIASPTQATVPMSTNPTSPQPLVAPAQEQRTFGANRGQGRKYMQRSYNAQSVPQQDSAPTTTSPIGFKKFAETQDFVPQQQVVPTTNGVHKQKRYSSQRAAQTVPNQSTETTTFKKDNYYEPPLQNVPSRLPPSGEFIPRSQQKPVPYTQYAPHTQPAPVQPVPAIPPMQYGMYPSQFQYSAPYSYTGYIDPQGVPFAPVQYMPYYPMPGDADNQASFGRGKSQFAPYTGKVWVPKNSKAIPITDPNEVQPRVSKAIPITDPNQSKSSEGSNSPATTS